MLWRKTHPALHAIILVIFAYSLFVFTDTLLKWLAQDFSIYQILLIGSVIPLVMSALWILYEKGWKGFSTPQLKWHLARALLMSCLTFLIVKALPLIPLADFYGIVFLSPLVILLLTAVFLKEKIGWHSVIAIAAGFIGVVILAGPHLNHLDKGTLLTFLSMILIAVNIILIRKTGHDYAPLYIFFPSLFLFIASLPFAVPSFEIPDTQSTLLFLLYGALILPGQLFLTLGFVRAPETAIVAPFHYIQILWGVVFGYFLFHDVPSLTTITGAGIIIGSGLYTIWREHQLEHPPPKETKKA